MLKAVIFDFNGVILNDEPVHMMMFQKVLSEEGISLSQEEYYSNFLGMDDVGCFKSVYEFAGKRISDEQIEALVQRKSVLYDAYIKDHMEFFPKSVELIQKTSKQYHTAIVSGALKHEIEFALKKAKVKKCFKAIIAQEDVAKGKPDPEGYLKALDALNKKIKKSEKTMVPAECLVIEDSFEGIHSAKEAGMKVAAVAHTYTKEQLTAEADWVFEEIKALSLKKIEEVF